MSEMIQVLNHQQRRIMLRRVMPKAQPTDVAIYDELLIDQGMNNVDNERLVAFRESNSNNEVYFKIGHLEVVGLTPAATDEPTPALAQGGGDLAKISLPSALKVIGETQSRVQLKRWIDQDGRPEIRAALIAQYVALETSNDESGRVTEAAYEDSF